MKREVVIIVFAIIAFMQFMFCSKRGPVDPLPTATTVVTATASPNLSFTATAVVSPTATMTRTDTATFTNTFTATLTWTESNTPTVTLTRTVTATSTNTRTVTPTMTPSNTPTITPTSDGFSSVTSAGITFAWKVNGANLECRMSAPTTGWIAIGLNSAPQMNGSNMVVGYVSSGGTPFVQDQKGGFHFHFADTIDDVTAVSGTETGGITMLNFTIPLADDANGHDFGLVQGNTYWLIVTNGGNNEDTLSAPGMPGNRGAVQVVL